MHYFINSLTFFSVIIGIFLSIHFFLKKQPSFLLLGSFLFAFSCETFLLFIQKCFTQPLLINFLGPWLSIPFFYLFVLSLNSSEATKIPIKKRELFIPWALSSIYKIYWLLQPAAKQSVFFGSSHFRAFEFIDNCISHGFALVLLIIIIKYLIKHQVLGIKQMSWLRFLAYALVMVTLIKLINYVVGVWLPDGLFTNLILLLTFYTLCQVGIQSLEISTMFNQSKRGRLLIGNSPAPLFPSRLQQEVYARLEKLMQVDKVYRKLDLTLEDLAEQLEVKKQVLSQVIHHNAKVSYFDYVNRYRLDEFKVKLGEGLNQRLNIGGMAREAGFKSKATLYKYFKEAEGTTPGEYQKKKFLEKS